MILAGYDVFFFVGCCVYPLVLEAGLITPGIEGMESIASIGKPGPLTALHVFAVALGMFVGYLLGREPLRAASREYLSRYRGLPQFFVRDPFMAWRAITLLGITVLVAFTWIVGFDVAVINALASRAGDFEGFGEEVKWLFLKTVGIVCGFSFVFFPAVLLLRTDRAWLLLYIGFVFLLYLESPSRGVFLSALIVPFLVYFYASKGFSKLRLLTVLPILVLVAAAILLYGKHFVTVPLAVLAGDPITGIDAYQSDSGFGGVFEFLGAYFYSYGKYRGFILQSQAVGAAKVHERVSAEIS